MPRKRDQIRDFLFKRNASPSLPDQQYLLFQAASDSSGAVLPVPNTPTRNQSTALTEINVKEVAAVAWEGVKTALVLLKESSDWFPPLKAASGGVVALIDTIEVSRTNFFLSPQCHCLI